MQIFNDFSTTRKESGHIFSDEESKVANHKYHLQDEDSDFPINNNHNGHHYFIQ